MDITAYSRNLRGVNDGKDFAPEYLASPASLLPSDCTNQRMLLEIYLRLNSQEGNNLTRRASKPSWIRIRMERVTSKDKAD